MSKDLMGGSFQNSLSFHGSMAIITCSQEFSSKLLKNIIKIIEEQSKIELRLWIITWRDCFPRNITKWSTLPSRS